MESETQTADPFADVPNGDPFAQPGSLGGENPGEPDQDEAGNGEPTAEHPGEPVRPEVQNGSLGGEDNADVADGASEPPEVPEPSAPEAPTEPEQPRRPRRRRTGARKKEATTPIRTYLIFEQGMLENDQPYFWQATQVQARNSVHALRVAFKSLYTDGNVGEEHVLVAVAESMWRPVPVSSYQPRGGVAVRVGA